MKRLHRAILVASALICAASLAQWARSRHAHDDFRYTRYGVSLGGPTGVCWTGCSYSGVLSLMRIEYKAPEWNERSGNPSPGFSQLTYKFDQAAFQRDGNFLQRAGFDIWHKNPVDEVWGISFPFWSIALATAFMPARWLAIYLRANRRVAQGLCENCGYDLRATPDRCPECGAAPALYRVPAIQPIPLQPSAD